MPKILERVHNHPGDWRTTFKRTFDTLHYDMKSHTNCEYSGSTCCSLVIQGRKLISANVGDSRAIIVHSSGTATQLTRDHKPDLPDENARILGVGGRVTTSRKDPNGNEIGPKRVYLSNQDIPGLAMSRSLGDYLAHEAGVSHEPEIEEYTI